jgi:hypothetical protein
VRDCAETGRYFPVGSKRYSQPRAWMSIRWHVRFAQVPGAFARDFVLSVYKGLSSSSHTIAARECFDYHYSSADIRTLTPRTVWI